ncbi:GNAT family N-acetyltransferase [Fretibacter rubidus]|uniref:GNAT family N-acetyltransferase n=1 Tax=Fretibacter rubidus TaxID=570162 RepID=UPI00352A99E1
MIRPIMRHATSSDLDTLVDIENRAFTGNRLSRRSLKMMIFNPRAVMLVCDVDQHIVGYGLILHRQTAQAARLYSLAIDPKFQGRGLSRSLLLTLETHTDKVAISLEVRADNQAAIGLYDSLDYVKLKTRKAYYDDGIDAVVMRKALHQ